MGTPRTRRELLAAAGAGALGALALPSAVRAAAPAAGELESIPLGTLTGAARAVTPAAAAAMFAVSWRGPRRARIEARFRGRDGRWSAWAPVGGNAHAGDGSALNAGEPLWARWTRAIELRAPATPVQGVVLHALSASRLQATEAARYAPATPRLDAGPGQPSILARHNWAGNVSPPRKTPAYGRIEMGFVHHTDSPNGYSAAEVPSMIRGIYIFHRNVNGWDDIGYNFVVDLYGRIWEARAGGIDQAVVGAHAGGFNLYSSGVAVIGNFQALDVSPQAKRALAALLGWKLALHGVPYRGKLTVRATAGAAGHSSHRPGSLVTLPRIAGHRDADQTGCPGQVLYDDLPALRGRVQGAFAHHATLTLAHAPRGTKAPAGAPAGPLRLLEGRLIGAAGAPIAGASVQIQLRSVARRGERVSERTLTSARTDARGHYLAAVPAATAGIVRGLCTKAGALGAVVSRDLQLRRA